MEDQDLIRLTHLFLGAIFTLIGTAANSWFQNWISKKKESRNRDQEIIFLRNGFHAEVTALIKMAEDQDIKCMLKENIDYLESQKEAKMSFFSTMVSDVGCYLSFYQHNIDKLGLLDEELLSNIVKFYSYMRMFMDGTRKEVLDFYREDVSREEGLEYLCHLYQMFCLAEAQADEVLKSIRIIHQ